MLVDASPSEIKIRLEKHAERCHDAPIGFASSSFPSPSRAVVRLVSFPSLRP
jgi:hypothetical protein